MKIRHTLFLFLLLGLFFLSGCAPEANPSVDLANADGDTAGFWMGIWHGMIAPITFLISLFSDKVGIYEVFNSGGWYNFGFMLGLSCSLGGSGFGGSRASRRRRG